MYRALTLSSRSGTDWRPMTKNTRACPSESMTARTGCDIAGPLGLEARGELVEALLFQRCAGEVADVLAKAGTQALDIKACHLRRGDDRPFRHDEFLICRGLRRHRHQCDEQSDCAHAGGNSKE